MQPAVFLHRCLLETFVWDEIYSPKVPKGRTIIFLEGGDEKFTGTNNFFSATSTQNNFFFRQRFCKQFFFLRNAMLFYEEFYVTTLVLPLTE